MSQITLDADHALYSIRYDASKNRIYFKIKPGDWTIDQCPNFESDFDKIIAKTKPNWTLFGDTRNKGNFTPEVEELHQKVQGGMLQKGCKRVAQWTTPMAMVEINEFSAKSGLLEIMKGFNTEIAAEVYLDKVNK